MQTLWLLHMPLPTMSALRFLKCPIMTTCIYGVLERGDETYQNIYREPSQ
jgi:hypothetical protein